MLKWSGCHWVIEVFHNTSVFREIGCHSIAVVCTQHDLSAIEGVTHREGVISQDISYASGQREGVLLATLR